MTLRRALDLLHGYIELYNELTDYKKKTNKPIYKNARVKVYIITNY